MDYQPRLIHASMCVFIAIGLLGFSTDAHGNIFTALLLGTGVFLFFAAVIVYLIWYGHRFDVAIRYIETFIKLDPEQRSSLGYAVPALRLRATRGQVGEYFEDTRATVEHVRLFLNESTRENTASQHAWNTAEKPRWAWFEIYDWLERHGKVWPGSASGSKSYKWRGSAFQSMMFYWLSASVPDLNTGEMSRAYASDTPSPTELIPTSDGFQPATHSRGAKTAENRGSGSGL